MKEEELLQKLFETFRMEAEEHLNALSSGLVALEEAEAPEDRTPIVETVYREAHSLKGAARSVNRTDVEDVCQALENVLAALKEGRIEAGPQLFDALHETLDTISRLLTDASGVNIAGLIRDLVKLQSEQSPAITEEAKLKPRAEAPHVEHSTAEADTADDSASEVHLPQSREHESFVQYAETVESYEPIGSASHPVDPQATAAADSEYDPSVTKDIESPNAATRPYHGGTVRISVDKLDPLLLQVEEMLSVKLTTTQRADEIREVVAALDVWEKRWVKALAELRSSRHLVRSRSTTPGMDDVDQIFGKLRRFLDWNLVHFKEVREKVRVLSQSAYSDSRQLGGLVDELLEDMKTLLMLPFSSLLEAFPKIVRDLGRQLGKDVKLIVEGGELEIDRRILEEVRDPLIHLVRNAIDHGIESPDRREKIGKPRRGLIRIAISRVGSNQAEITVTDDGGGIDAAKVNETAEKRGIVVAAPDRPQLDQKALSVVFQSGFSTSSTVSHISGRGLGLAIVREKAERLGGRITLESRPQRGTTFRMVLPVSLATFRGILVETSGRMFVVPAAAVERVPRVSAESRSHVGSSETIHYEGRPISLVNLSDVLELPAADTRPDDSGFFHCLVIRVGDKRIAFAVDRILDEQEVLVKSLGNQLSRVRNIAGATILGSGKLVPILNVLDLIKSATKLRRSEPPKALTKREEKPRSVLVAEDSITSRMLLKNLLESAGYHVTTAVDGSAAWSALQTDRFDLLVSDVEMPHTNGFELTAKVRKDQRLQGLPIVLVTALGSREDRERGMDAGADAYIVKSSFDQSDLLNVVERLI